MELIETLVLLSLTGTFILFLTCIYLMAKIKMLEIIVKEIKSPEKYFKEMLKGKIPVLRNKETGEYILPGQGQNLEMEEYKPSKKFNPIVG